MITKALSLNGGMQISCRKLTSIRFYIDHTFGEYHNYSTHASNAICANTRLKCVALPDDINRSLERIVQDFPIKSIQRDSHRLRAYIHSRHPPLEKGQRQEKITEFVNEIKKKSESNDSTEEHQPSLKQSNTLRNMCQQRIYNWKPLQYGAYEAVVYAVGRSALEYSILLRIFREIYMRDSNFTPRSFFDFGSGVGTGTWAANTFWSQSIFEWYNVDSSQAMNDLAELILRDRKDKPNSMMNNVFYRRFLPNIQTQFDLMLSAFTLFEMSSLEHRQDVMLNMWKKCSGYLIIVEEGSRRGSELVNETRDYLLSLNDPTLQGHVFAPCPHSLRCPRHVENNDGTPCNFENTYAPSKMSGKSNNLLSKYSYVIFKKASAQADPTQNWPRVIRPILHRSKHLVGRFCLPTGKLSEVVFTQSKHGKIAYQCLKESSWGDRVPLPVDNPNEETHHNVESDTD